jgi:uncharacterized protein
MHLEEVRMTESRPLIGVQRRFFDTLAQGGFQVPRCSTCDALHFPPRVMCPQCAGTAFRWTALSGRGVVYSATTVRRKTDAGGDYGVCLIDLDEGLRLMSRVEGMAPHEVLIGQRVVARLRPGGGEPLPVFEPHHVEEELAQ